MAKTKDKPTQAIETLRPYVKRALEDPDLRDDLLAAFVTARGLYDQVAKGRGVKGKAAKISDKDFQEQIQELIDDLSETGDRLQSGKPKSHKARNRVILLTGVTLGVLYNPWTGAQTREWIMERIAGGDGNGFEEFSEELAAAEAETSGDGGEESSEQ